MPHETDWGIRPFYGGDVMVRFGLWCLLSAGLLAGVGCKNFTYVSKDANGGVVQLKAGEEAVVLESLKKEYGTDIEVLEIVPMDQTGAAFNPSTAGMQLSGTGVAGDLTASAKPGKVQLHFRKKPATGTTPEGLPAVQDSGLLQTSYPGLGNSPTRLPDPQDCTTGTCPTGK